MMGVRYRSAGSPAGYISRTSAKNTETAVRPREIPNVKVPTTIRLTGTKRIEGRTGARTTSMITSNAAIDRPRLTRPERIAESVKMERGTRTRFMSGPFHATPAIALVVVCATKFQATYADR